MDYNWNMIPAGQQPPLRCSKPVTPQLYLNSTSCCVFFSNHFILLLSPPASWFFVAGGRSVPTNFHFIQTSVTSLKKKRKKWFIQKITFEINPDPSERILFLKYSIDVSHWKVFLGKELFWFVKFLVKYRTCQWRPGGWITSANLTLLEGAPQYRTFLYNPPHCPHSLSLSLNQQDFLKNLILHIHIVEETSGYICRPYSNDRLGESLQ